MAEILGAIRMLTAIGFCCITWNFDVAGIVTVSSDCELASITGNFTRKFSDASSIFNFNGCSGIVTFSQVENFIDGGQVFLGRFSWNLHGVLGLGYYKPTPAAGGDYNPL